MSSYTFKVVLLGQECVGKSSLVLRYVSNLFNESHHSTLPASFLRKQLYIDQDRVTLNLWDTAGQEKFHALGPIYYREAQGALVVYDVTNADSVKKAKDWVRELNRMLGPEKVRVALIGNKLDLLPEHEQLAPLTNHLVLEITDFASGLNNTTHFLTSVKLNKGLNELFVRITKQMVADAKSQLALRNQRQAEAMSNQQTLTAVDLARNSNQKTSCNC